MVSKILQAVPSRRLCLPGSSALSVWACLVAATLLEDLTSYKLLNSSALLHVCVLFQHIQEPSVATSRAMESYEFAREKTSSISHAVFLASRAISKSSRRKEQWLPTSQT
eukprot:scpid33368/ scgid10073/ 